MTKISKSNPFYEPWHAGKMAAQYMPADPQAWLDAAAASGMAAELIGDNIAFWEEGVPDDDFVFFKTWLRETPGGKEALKALLKKRGLSRPHF
jgi:hypothetical protein